MTVLFILSPPQITTTTNKGYETFADIRLLLYHGINKGCIFATAIRKNINKKVYIQLKQKITKQNKTPAF